MSRRESRLHGKVVFSSSTDAKTKALEISQKLASMYSVDDTTFEMFYIEEGEAIFISQETGESKIVKL